MKDIHSRKQLGFCNMSDGAHKKPLRCSIFISSTDELKKVIIEEENKTVSGDVPKGIYAFLGEYRLGQITISEKEYLSKGIFCISYSAEKDETGIAAVLSKYFNRPIRISETMMTAFLAHKVSLEFFLELTVANTYTDVVITAEPKVCAALLRSGYKKVMRLGDAVCADDSDMYNHILFLKHVINDREEFCDAVEIVDPNVKGQVWFVSNAIQPSGEVTRNLNIASARQLLSFIDSIAETEKRIKCDGGAPYIRMNFGQYAIGGVSWDKKNKRFVIDGLKRWGSDSFGEKMSELFGHGMYLTVDEMDSLIANFEYTIEEFFTAAFEGHETVRIADKVSDIYRLLQMDYVPVTTLNEILVEDCKEDGVATASRRHDARIIFIKQPVKSLFT